jgi:hypothetical protein
MIRRKLLMATAMIASVGINACSDTMAPKKLAPGGFSAAVIPANEGAVRQEDADNDRASSPRSGALHATKECSGFKGLAGSFCTITSSSLDAIEVGSRVVYLQPASNKTPAGSDVVLFTPGPGNNTAFGHCSTYFGLCTFSGGTGKFWRFHASVVVTHLTGLNWAWNGTYSFSKKGDSESLDATFTKWRTTFPHMVGVVGGDVGVGTYAGEILNVGTVGNTTNIEALYHFNGEDHAFTAHVYVAQDNVAGTAAITGTVTKGWLEGANVLGEYRVWATCPIPTPGNGLGTRCFRGVLQIQKGGGD